ncbi:ParA family protein [Kineococcus esterisolvens]|uniref:ParA family protein n=1 Tax=unclassified Kineococcus TaxID=2621656 RepID=UPI003D7E178D
MDTLAFFNHKGGVGKTTLVFNVGLALASQGRKVVFLDLDAQANLTSVALPERELEETFSGGGTVYEALRPLIVGTGDFKDVSLVQLRETAWLLPGHIRLSEFEEISPQAWTEAVAGNARGFLISTAIRRLAMQCGQSVNADYVLIDLGPNVGALNRTALLAADGFVIPLAPDLFSLAALPSVGRSTALWVEEWRAAKAASERRGLELGFEIPLGEPSPLGYISQQFAVYREAPAAAFRRWIDRIPGAYSEGVISPLQSVGVKLPSRTGKIGEVRNLSSLAPMAQRANQAIFELSGSEARGSQFTRARDTRQLFVDLATEIAERLAEVK